MIRYHNKRLFHPLGNLNFLAHKKQSNKLRKVKVIHTKQSPDSDVSSLDSNTESLKSEDVFTGADVHKDDEDESGASGGRE